MIRIDPEGVPQAPIFGEKVKCNSPGVSASVDPLFFADVFVQRGTDVKAVDSVCGGSSEPEENGADGPVLSWSSVRMAARRLG
jgi:hypothetical protein